MGNRILKTPNQMSLKSPKDRNRIWEDEPQVDERDGLDPKISNIARNEFQVQGPRMKFQSHVYEGMISDQFSKGERVIIPGGIVPK